LTQKAPLLPGDVNFPSEGGREKEKRTFKRRETRRNPLASFGHMDSLGKVNATRGGDERGEMISERTERSGPQVH